MSRQHQLMTQSVIMVLLQHAVNKHVTTSMSFTANKAPKKRHVILNYYHLIVLCTINTFGTLSIF